jgi:hypothetical protein
MTKIYQHHFHKWIDTFLEEKGFDPEYIIEQEGKYNLHFIKAGHIIGFIKGLDDNLKEQIKTKFVQIDFANGDYMHFIKYLAKGYIAIGEQHETNLS